MSEKVQKLKKRDNMAIESSNPTATIIIGVAIICVIWLVIIAKIQENQSVRSNPLANASITTTTKSLTIVPNDLGLIAIIVIFSLMLFVITHYIFNNPNY